jgi:hypothetical protein
MASTGEVRRRLGVLGRQGDLVAELLQPADQVPLAVRAGLPHYELLIL